MTFWNNMWSGLGMGGRPGASATETSSGLPILSEFTLPAVAGDPTRASARVMDGTTLFNGTAVPGAGSSPAGLGMNLPTLQLGGSILGQLGTLWTGMQASKLAKDQLDFVRSTTNRNLNNQTQLINTRIEDRARARGAMEGQTPEQVQSYIDRNRISR